jgi:hypothetical protein
MKITANFFLAVMYHDNSNIQAGPAAVSRLTLDARSKKQANRLVSLVCSVCSVYLVYLVVKTVENVEVVENV